MKPHSDVNRIACMALTGYYPGTRIRMIRGGISGGGGSTSTQSNSRATWPSEFLAGANPTVGQPLSMNELLAGRTQTSGLFSPAPSAGASPSTTAPAPGVGMPNPSGTAYGNYLSANAPPPGVFSSIPYYTQGGVNAAAPPLTSTPVSRVTPSTDNTGMGIFNTQGLQNTGIGAAPTTYAPPSNVNQGVFVDPNAPGTQAQAATATLAPSSYGQLQKSIFSQNYDPAAQAIERTGAQQDRSLQSTLANSGLASSGAGIGQEAMQQQNRAKQLGDLATNAAATATTQTLTLQEQEAQANAARQQQTNLANAGFNQQAQITNAANLLAGNTANAANYLATLGLDQTSANQAKTAFLNYLGIQESDMARMDQTQQQSLALAYNTWLQQYATLGNIGRTTNAMGDSSNMNVGIGAGVLGGGKTNTTTPTPSG